MENLSIEHSKHTYLINSDTHCYLCAKYYYIKDNMVIPISTDSLAVQVPQHNLSTQLLSEEKENVTHDSQHNITTNSLIQYSPALQERKTQYINNERDLYYNDTHNRSSYIDTLYISDDFNTEPDNNLYISELLLYDILIHTLI